MANSPVEKVQKTSSLPQRESIKGLLEHAQFQRQGKTWYVYFPYCFSTNGKREQERDYIGTLSPDGSEFRPNLYYVQNEPVFEKRPVDRWKNPIMRPRALDKLNEKKVSSFIQADILNFSQTIRRD